MHKTGVRSKQQIVERLQRIEDNLFLIFVGYAVWVAAWFVVGLYTAGIERNHATLSEGQSTFHHFFVVGMLFTASAIVASSVLWNRLQDLLTERNLLNACLVLMEREQRSRTAIRARK